MATNDGGSAVGILAEVSGSSGTMVSDAQWKCSNTFSADWPSVDFDDSAWDSATEIGNHIDVCI